MDLFQFFIALIVIISFTAFVAQVIVHNSDFDNSFKILAMIAPFVGTIIGFYFGQKPVQGLTQQVTTASGKNLSFTEKTLEAGDIIEHQRDIINRLAQEIASLKQDIENLNNQKSP